MEMKEMVAYIDSHSGLLEKKERTHSIRSIMASPTAGSLVQKLQCRATILGFLEKE